MWHKEAVRREAIDKARQVERAALIESLSTARIRLENEQLERRTAKLNEEISVLEGRRPNGDAAAYLSAAIEYDKLAIEAKEAELATLSGSTDLKLDIALESKERMEKRIAIGLASLFCVGFAFYFYFLGKSPPGIAGLPIREAA
jgi:hypothetical protein